ncbi:MAG: hypothetical protein WC855_10455 [Thermodesulfovibrionales bacterium]
MNTRPIRLIIFTIILISIVVLGIRTSITKNKRGIISDHLSREYLHIEKIDEARQEYINISEVSRARHLSNDLVGDLTQRTLRIFNDEKYLLGKDKDQLLSELRGMPGDVYKDILAFDKAVNEWCEMVKFDTIETFSKTGGNQKFLALMKLRDNITTLKRKYVTGFVSWLDIFLLGVPLFAALTGIVGQIYSMLRQTKKNDQS